MKVLVFDLETTGLLEDPKAKVTEISWIVYDTVFKRDVSASSHIIDELGFDDEISDEIYQLTGINKKLVNKYGVLPSIAIQNFNTDIINSEGIVMASNGEIFDVPMIHKFAARWDFSLIPIKACIDDFYDVPYPSHFKGRNLSHKAADHGFLNMRAHSGLSDVMTLIGIIEKGGYSWEEMLESAQSPLVVIEALVSKENKDLAKNLGFIWNGIMPYKWCKRMREAKFNKIKSELPFQTQLYRET